MTTGTPSRLASSTHSCGIETGNTTSAIAGVLKTKVRAAVINRISAPLHGLTRTGLHGQACGVCPSRISGEQEGYDQVTGGVRVFDGTELCSLDDIGWHSS